MTKQAMYYVVEITETQSRDSFGFWINDYVGQQFIVTRSNCCRSEWEVATSGEFYLNTIAMNKAKVVATIGNIKWKNK